MANQKRDFYQINVDITIILGSLMIAFGIILIGVSASISVFGQDSNELIFDWLLSALSSLGTGVFAAGIITLTLERANRKRQVADIKEIKDAHSEAILSELIPEPIFLQIKEHIIQKPFLRTAFKGNLTLTWKDENRLYLKKDDLARYTVKNVSSTEQQYKIRVAEELKKDHMLDSDDSTKIEYIKIRRNGKQDVYSIENNNLNIINRKFRIEAEVIESLQTGESIEVSLLVSSVVDSRDFYLYATNAVTTELDLTVIHPKEIIVFANPLHPSYKDQDFNEFQKEQDGNETMKIWEIEHALLPFQGIELHWYPKEENNKVW